jgi:RNA polymerase sigma factor (sigma-70 family)
MTGTQAGVLLRQIHKLAGPPDTPDGELLERFTAAREGPAFEALLRRYGPMVLGVCRRVLGNAHDAEDAFQATFLTLARKADSICKRDSLGSWLYGVAFRVAARARGQAAARRRHEGQAHAASAADPLAELTGRELLTILDEELQGLPERARLPLVLCYLQGLTCDEAARRAGWSLRTFSRRLEQGRQRLRGRLARRGLALPAALMATGLTQAAAPAVPTHLAGVTFRAALHNAAGEGPSAAEGGASATATWTAAFASLRLRVVAAVLLGCLLACGAAVLAQQGPAARQPLTGVKRPAPGARPQKPAPPAEQGLTLAGRVLGADGKPLAGADVALVGRWRLSPQHPNHDYEVLARGKADAQGRFRLARKDLSPAAFYQVHALASGKGHGLGWAKLPADPKRKDVTIRLEAERVVRGRLFDLQGVAAKGVKARLVYLAWVEPREDTGDPRWRRKKGDAHADLALYLQALAMAQGAAPTPPRLPGGFELGLPRPPEGLPFWPRPVMTDPQGRFEIRGLSAGQAAHLLVEDDRFALQELLLDTGKEKAPAEATLSLSPSQRIEGRVVYEDTGKPVVGTAVNLSAFRGGGGKLSVARTDAEGRFSINPYAGAVYLVRTAAPAGEPYLGVQRQLKWPRGAARQTVDLILPRGVEVRGKVTEVPSGKALDRVRIVYLPRKDNEAVKKHQPLVGTSWPAHSAADGSYRLVVPPGPGHLLVDAEGPDYVVRTTTLEELATGKAGGPARFHHEVLALSPQVKDGPKALDIQLRRGVNLRITVLGPDGKRVPEVTVVRPVELVATADNWLRTSNFVDQLPRAALLGKGSFELPGCDPDRTYRVLVVDTAVNVRPAGLTGGGGGGVGNAKPRPAEEPKAGAVVEVSAAKARGGELTVQLQPCGSAQVRLLDATGKPSRVTPWVEVEVVPERGKLQGERAILTPRGVAVRGKNPLTPDAEGVVTVRGLIPGATYRLRARDAGTRAVVALGEAFTVEAGKTRKLPDIVAPQTP